MRAACIVLCLMLAACDQESTDLDTTTDTGTDTTTDSGDDPTMDTTVDTEPDVPADTASDAEDAVTARVQFDTTMGTFVVGLYGNATPITTENFLRYVDDGFYDGLIFHRVMPDFMIQGGGYDEGMTQHPPSYPPITLEIADWIHHTPGVISMARTSDPDSATSQFFVCVDSEPDLDGNYAAFGMTESGYDVVQSISLVSTHVEGAHEHVPDTPVVINSATRL